MTMNKLWDKLRKKNISKYRQFQFCITFAVMLISSYLMMLMSPLVQNTLPVGGDSRTQIYMIFALAVAGCTIFVLYATGLFYRYKSREIGIFLALGSDKGKMTKAVLVETAKLVGECSLLGFVIGSVLSLIIGKIFQAIASKANNNTFSLTLVGALGSVIYAAVVFVIVLLAMLYYMRRSNVMDILNQERKQEPLKKQVTRSYLFLGFGMLIVGVLVALVIPRIVTALFSHWLGAWTNLFYLLVLLGLYRIMVYSIASHKRGRNPQKYYNNVISYGMLKFQGASIVRNMLVITLLIMGGLFASYYVPMALGGMGELKDEAMYGYRYPLSADEITEGEVKALGDKYEIGIQNFRSGEFVEVIASGVRSENIDEKGNLISEYEDKFARNECIGASEYQKLTGQQVDVKEGTYYMIMSEDARENVYFKFGMMDKLYLGDSDEYLPMTYKGKVIYQSLMKGYGFDEEARYLISDADYEALKAELSGDYIINQVLFDSDKGEGLLAFSNELYKEFALRASEKMKVPSSFDEIARKNQGADYGYNYPAEYDPENPAMETDWQYAPAFVYMQREYVFIQYAVFFLLFLYVSIICLAAVAIISYTRSQSVGISSRQVFDDIAKLGADKNYIYKLLKVQIKKVYFLPTLVGCLGMGVFEILMLYMNDGKYSAGEMRALGIMAVLTGVVVLFQYGMYRRAMKTVAREVIYN